MKTKITLIALLCAMIGLAQAPTGYYSTATATGYTLKTQLYNIIKGHTDRGYAGLWTTYSTSDRDNQYENDNSIIDVYSENPTGVDPYKYTYSTSQCGTYAVEGDCYNREHMIPQSVFNSAAPMVSDAHFIPPTDGKVNGVRSDYPHGKVATASWTSRNGSKLGSSAVSGYTGTVFEPINEFKGDIARMYFYFATRYENTVASYSYAMFNRTSNQVFTTAFRDMLLQWHAQDPVSAREIARNNAIYARQGNRNPFIDNPNYVNQIWGTVITTDSTAPTTPTNLVASSLTATSCTLSWSASSDNVGVTGYNIYQNNVLKTTVSGTSVNISGLTAATTYSFYVRAKDAAGNISASSTSINVTTTSSTPTVSDLYFSEYLEGSSNNKALEITNRTGTSINLSAYSIKKQTNGAGSWSTGLTLSGTIANNGKYVVVNSSIASTCYATTTANLATAATELAFNGNDAIGLFKNGTLIDIIGTFNGGTVDFSIDETLRRKSTATVPKATFNKTTDWDIYAVDTCTGIGNRIASNTATIKTSIKIYPNPSKGNFEIAFKNSGEQYSVEVFSVLGQKVYEMKNISSDLIGINNLAKGIYLVKVNQNENSFIKQVIVE
jgi:endonuclease I/chitodextrinase